MSDSEFHKTCTDDCDCRCHISPPCNHCVEHYVPKEDLEQRRCHYCHKDTATYEEDCTECGFSKPATKCKFHDELLRENGQCDRCYLEEINSGDKNV